MPLHPLEHEGMAESSTTGNSTISSQLVAGSIKVRHIKLISVPSCPLRVYGPISSTHNASQEFCITSFVGTLPFLFFVFCLVGIYGSFCRIFVWYFPRLSNKLQLGVSP